MSAEKYETSKQAPGVEQEYNTITQNIFTEDVIDPIYQAKAHILNDALQEIGMGRYQWWAVCFSAQLEAILSTAQGIICSNRLWVVDVSPTELSSHSLLTLGSGLDSDNLWPVGRLASRIRCI